MDDETGLNNCVTGLKKFFLMQKKKVLFELFNSKVDHPDYMCDNTSGLLNYVKDLILQTLNYFMIYIICKFRKVM